MIAPAWQRIHGGPQSGGAVQHDFSVNSNACGPCPAVLQALQQADPARYPDPAYRNLRQQLARWHGVEVWRVVLAASASECITRITAWAARRGLHHVSVPAHAYGDYAHAARCWGMTVHATPMPPVAQPVLQWIGHPSSPAGQAAPPVPALREQDICVMDRAYTPLQLHAAHEAPETLHPDVWHMYTPNKALGLTGIRAAYAIAPAGIEHAALALLEAMAPSWVLGAHGVALLAAWPTDAVQQWLRQSLDTLRDWKHRQTSALMAAGWECLPSLTSFFCARPPQPLDTAALQAGSIQLRDCTSFGLPGWWRLGVLPPASQDALLQVLHNTGHHD